MLRAAGRFVRVACMGLVAAAMLVQTSATLAAQQQFQFIIRATDANGEPVTDLSTNDVIVTEDGMPDEVTEVRPVKVPVRLTIAIDNGSRSQESLSQYRSGLEAMIKVLDEDLPVEFITLAPQPRRVVEETTDRDEIYRGINRFAPEPVGSPRFTDQLVEFSRKFQKEFEEKNAFDSIPVIVMVSTTANDAWSYGVPEVSEAITFLRARRTKVYVVMLTAREGRSVRNQINEGRQAEIGGSAVKATGGKYEEMAISNRLVELLPAWGEEINALHRTYNNQNVVTVQRREGLTGPLRNPQIEIAREGINGEVALEPVPPMAE